MMPSKSFVFRFDDVEVREREFTLTKAGKVLAVEPKAFRTLLFLLHNPQRLIAKEELLNTVWGDTAVTEGSLTRCIWLLRTALGDDIHQPRYIKTVATVGYRFVCEVEVSEDIPGSLEGAGEPDRLPPVADKAPEKDLNLEHESRAPDVAPAGSNGNGNSGQMRLETAAPSPALAGNVADGETRNEKSKEESRKRFRRWLLTVLAVVVLLALGAGSYFYFHRTPKLTDKDTIVLADFTNRTEDAVFDGTLREGLSVQLEQSPFLNIISDQQSRQTLQMMGQNPDAKITPQIARELCQRTGSAAVVNGSIAEIGTRYLLTLKAVSCVSGESLASAEAQAIGQEQRARCSGKNSFGNSGQAGRVAQHRSEVQHAT